MSASFPTTALGRPPSVTSIGGALATLLLAFALQLLPAHAEARPGAFIEVDLGLSYVNLASIDDDNLDPGLSLSSGTGLTFGFAGGLEFGVLQLGLRANHGRQGAFNLNTIGLHVAVHIPVPLVRPVFRLGLGYAFLGDAEYSVFDDDPATRGFAASLGAGIDIRPNEHLSFGVIVDAGVLNLNRERAVSRITTVDATKGHAVGLQVRGTAHLTLHL